MHSTHVSITKLLLPWWHSKLSFSYITYKENISSRLKSQTSETKPGIYGYSTIMFQVIITLIKDKQYYSAVHLTSYPEVGGGEWVGKRCSVLCCRSLSPKLISTTSCVPGTDIRHLLWSFLSSRSWLYNFWLGLYNLKMIVYEKKKPQCTCPSESVNEI